MSVERMVIFSDLDGTLLDKYSYSYEQAFTSIELVKSRKIPLIFCSAKTRAEQEVYRSELSITDPFIVENGGAIFIPKGYFPFDVNYSKESGHYLVIELGIPYDQIRKMLIKVREESNCNFKGFGDMDVAEVAEITGLDMESAHRAKQREYDETLIFEMDAEDTASCIERMHKKTGLTCIHGGRFYNVMGPNDKGKAVSTLKNLFKKKWQNVKTIGIGDSRNDLPMLAKVDFPILVQKPDNRWIDVEDMRIRIHRINGAGPVGWRNAVQNIINGVWR